MRRFIFPFVMIALVLLMAPGCKMPIAPEFKGVSEFKLNRDNADKKPRLNVGVKVYNPNNYRVKLMAYDLQVFVGESLVGEAHEKRKQVILKNSTETLHFAVRTNLKQVMSGLGNVIGNLFSGKKGLEMKFAGTIRARALGISKTIPVDFTKLVQWKDLRQ